MSIYSIECKCGKCYVGSTVRQLTSRANEHRSEFVNPNRKSFYSPVYTHFRECGLTKEKMTLTLMQTILEDDDIKAEESKWINLIGELNQYDAVPNYQKMLARRERCRIKGQTIHQCPCGGSWSHHHRARHFKSLKHKNHLKNKILVDNINGKKKEGSQGSTLKN